MRIDATRNCQAEGLTGNASPFDYRAALD